MLKIYAALRGDWTVPSNVYGQAKYMAPPLIQLVMAVWASK